MIKITFPDGSVREYEAGVTGLQIAQSISQRLAQDVLACGVDGETVELSRPIMQDANIVLYKWEDAEGKHAFWHTSAHLLAEALQELYPGIQFGFGPAVENGSGDIHSRCQLNGLAADTALCTYHLAVLTGKVLIPGSGKGAEGG